MTLLLDMKLHARQKFSAFNVGKYVNLHHLDLLCPHQQQHRQGLDQLEPHDVLGLPVVQHSDLFQILSEHVYFVVVSEYK